MRRYITTESHEPIGEVRVDLSPGEQQQQQYGVESVRLLGAPELDQLRADLRALRSALMEEGGGNTPGRSR